jgi:hypothetical protein
MHYRMHCCTILVGTTVALLGVGFASAQELDDLQICKAAAASFQAYAAGNGDGDLESAKGLVAQGLADCEAGKTKEGLDTINMATAAISDNVQGSHKRK